MMGLRVILPGRPAVDVFMLRFPFAALPTIHSINRSNRRSVARDGEPVDAGLVRTLGVCNFSTQQLDMLLSSGCSNPACRARARASPILRRTAHVGIRRRTLRLRHWPTAGSTLVLSTTDTAQQALSWSIAGPASSRAPNSAQLLENLAMLTNVSVHHSATCPQWPSLSVLAQALPTLKQYMMEKGYSCGADGGLRCTCCSQQVQTHHDGDQR